MKNVIVFIAINLLFNFPLSAQNIEKMNKSDLIDYIGKLSTKIDSLRLVNITLNDSIYSLRETNSKHLTNSSLLLQKNKKFEDELQRLNDLILKNQNESKKTISEYENSITKLEETIKTLQDSISNLKESNINVASESTIDKKDFLNQYFFNQIPLPNNSFNLVLRKIVIGDAGSSNNNYNDKKVVVNLPEILDVNAFTFYSVKPNFSFQGQYNEDYNKKFNELVIPKNVSYFNSQLPKIEVLKNKLVTFKYNDSTEESFLFNVNKSELNNDRKVLQLNFANEEVRDDGSNNTAKDIVWKIFAIGDECYLALTSNQLNRLKLNLFDFSDGISYYNSRQEQSMFRSINCYNCITTGKGIYLSRNLDVFMDQSKYIDQKDLIYLFKLK